MFLSTLNFGVLLFALAVIAFILLTPNLLNLLLLCEVVWITLYFYGVVMGMVSDSLSIFIWGVFFLGLATGESVVGLSLLMFKFSIDGSIKKFYGMWDEQRNKGKGYSRFWNTKL